MALESAAIFPLIAGTFGESSEATGAERVAPGEPAPAPEAARLFDLGSIPAGLTSSAGAGAGAAFLSGVPLLLAAVVGVDMGMLQKFNGPQ